MPTPMMLVDVLSAGLRSDSRMPVNSQVAEKFRNLKPTVFGAAQLEALTYFNTIGVDGPAYQASHPYPNALNGKRATWMFDNRQVMKVDKTTRVVGAEAGPISSYSNFSAYTMTDASITPQVGYIDFANTPTGEAAVLALDDQLIPMNTFARIRVSITVTNHSSGTLQVYLGNTFATSIGSNGTVSTEAVVTGIGDFKLQALGTFNGHVAVTKLVQGKTLSRNSGCGGECWWCRLPRWSDRISILYNKRFH